jgi:hypothetical protein
MAKEYCDENGANCSTPNGVSGGITLYKRNFETNGATMNAHNGCIDQ